MYGTEMLEKTEENLQSHAILCSILAIQWLV
jgi:hypothetical protein